MKALHVLETLSPRFGQNQSGNKALASVAMTQSTDLLEGKAIFRFNSICSRGLAGLPA